MPSDGRNSIHLDRQFINPDTDNPDAFLHMIDRYAVQRQTDLQPVLSAQRKSARIADQCTCKICLCGFLIH